MKTIALCMNVPELDQGGFRYHDVCKKYPGSGWMPYLFLQGSTHFQVLSGTEARIRVISREIDLNDVWVIQEEMNPQAQALIGIGAHPAILFCLESPLYAPFFYDNAGKFMKDFPAQFLFQQGTHTLHFPSFDLNDIRDPEPLAGRKGTCMVVSNKYYKFYEDMFSKSPTWQDSIECQLHDARYSIIEALKKNSEFHLYGKGWPEGVGKEIPAGKKLDVIRHYSLSHCLENMRMYGYVTEKIFDAIVAGVVPFYGGAPDIERFVPNDIIMTRATESLQKLIDNGQTFIRSDQGKRHSYQGFATHMLEILENVTNQTRHKKRETSTHDQTHEHNLRPQLH